MTPFGPFWAKMALLDLFWVPMSHVIGITLQGCPGPFCDPYTTGALGHRGAIGTDMGSPAAAGVLLGGTQVDPFLTHFWPP